MYNAKRLDSVAGEPTAKARGLCVRDFAMVLAAGTLAGGSLSLEPPPFSPASDRDCGRSGAPLQTKSQRAGCVIIIWWSGMVYSTCLAADLDL